MNLMRTGAALVDSGTGLAGGVERGGHCWRRESGAASDSSQALQSQVEEAN